MKFLLIILLVIFSCGCKKTSTNQYYNSNNQYYSNNVDYSLGGDLEELIEEQKETDKLINSLKSDKSITFKNIHVLANPYKLSHLSALAIFHTESEESVKVYIQDKLEFELEKSKEHAIPIYGLYSDTNNKITIELGNGSKQDIYIKTDKVYGEDLEVTTNEVDRDLYFYISSGVSDENVIYDKNGKIRWYVNGYLNEDILTLENGHLLISNGIERDEKRKDIPTGLLEVDYLGKIYNQYLIPNGYHHEIRDIGDNKITLCTYAPENIARNDRIYILDLKNNNLETIDLLEIIKKESKAYADEISKNFDWAHINSVAYDENKNIMYVSLRNKNSIIALSLTTKSIEWIFTNTPKLWHKDFHKYIVSLNDKNIIMGQHSISIVDGNIAIFNNNVNMNRESEEYMKHLGASYPAVYSISKNAANIVYKYSSKESFYSNSHSSFKVYSSGEKLINYSVNEALGTDNSSSNMHIFLLDKNDNIIFKAIKKNDSTYSFHDGYLYENVYNYQVYDYKLVEVK